MTSGCGIKQADYATANQQLAPDGIQVLHAPIVTSNTLMTDKQSGFATKTYVLGFAITGDSVQGEQALIWDNVGQRQLKGLASVAAGRAIDAAGADGLYISRITADRTGIPPFYYDIDYTVTGYPVVMTDATTVDVQSYVDALFANEDTALRTPAKEASGVGGLMNMITSLLPF
jgi:hypothetical protein